MMKWSLGAADDHRNVFGALGFVLSRATTSPLAALCPTSLQAIDLQDIFVLQTRHHLASLSRSGVFRAKTWTRSWRDRDVQQPKSFVVADAAREPTVPASSKPDPRLVNLVRLLARQAARDFVQAETDSRTRDRLPE
jgi:hypothetical protein